MGQYTGSQDRLKALFQTEYLYNDVTIDWGELRNFVQISEEEFQSVETDRISEQSCLRNIKAYPAIKNQDFDGYNLALTEVRATDVQIVRAPQQDLLPFLGDIRFTLYGKISSTEFYTDHVEVIERPIIITPPPEKPAPKPNPSPPSLPPKNSGCFSGCLSTFGILFALIPLLGLLIFFISIGWIPMLIIIAVAGFIWLLNKFPTLGNFAGNSMGCLPRLVSGIFSLGIFLLLGWALLAMVMRGCGNATSDTSFQPPSPVVEETEKTQQEKIIQTQDVDLSENDENGLKVDSLESEPIFDTLIVHNRVWKDYQGNLYTLNLKLSKRDIRLSGNNRNQTPMPNRFGALYNELSLFNEGLLERIYPGLDSIRQVNQLGEKAFAEMIVSMVQDIPYKLILDTDCAEGAEQSRFVREYLSTCTEPCCLGNIRYGLQAPVEFLGNLYGDCDTRTLCLYTILKHFNYDVGIINSDQLAHSMLAINLPYTGDYKVYNNKRYYVWETTNVGFVPGFITPEYNNMNLWKMELTSK